MLLKWTQVRKVARHTKFLGTCELNCEISVLVNNLTSLHLVGKIIALSQSSAIHASKQESFLAIRLACMQTITICATFLDEG